MEQVRLDRVPEPRYPIGAHVWGALVEWGHDNLPCPDCLGSGKWAVKSPAGYEAEVGCPRCEGRKVLKVETRKGRAQPLTVGSIQINTAYCDNDRGPVQYMCVETGVGSGTVYYEQRLFSSEAEAQADADLRAAEEMAKVMATPHGRRIEGLRQLSQYQLKDAQVKDAEQQAWRVDYDFRQLVERIHGLLDEDGTGTYLMSSGFEEEAEMISGRLELPAETIKLLQDHLCSYNERAAEALREYRAADKECRC